MQTPVGSGLDAWLDSRNPSGVGSHDESADRPAASLLQGLRGTSPPGDTQVARVEKSADAKLPGLNRLQELTAACDAASKPAAWRDNLIVPEPSPPSVRKLTMGISAGAVAGVLVCVLALHLTRNSTANRRPEQVPPVQEVTKAAFPASDVTDEETASRKAAGEKQLDRDKSLVTQERTATPDKSTPARLKSRFDPEVLFRLDLSLEQASRVRTILDRCSKDLPFAEEQIRALLSEEQNRRWQSIAP
jgi:hypothetical protein